MEYYGLLELMENRNLYFAWFNKGSNHNVLGEYTEAAFAYDFAFTLYRELPVALRPWRMMWYQSGPYEAYYQTGRYEDVIGLVIQ